MKHSTLFLWILALSLAAPLAYAHDPKEHAKEAIAAKARATCAAMKDMDPSTMDPNDPVMQAMMARCGPSPAHDAVDHPHTSNPADAAGGH